MRRTKKSQEWIIILLLLALFTNGCRESKPTTPPVVKTPTITMVAPTPTEAPTPAPTALPSIFQPLSVTAPDCGYGGLFKSIETVDEYTVRFTLCTAEPAFLAKISFPAFGIQSREWLEGAGRGYNLLSDQPVGTGPYRVSEWKQGKELIFTAFEGYWGSRKARTPKLIFRWKTDAAERLLELQAGSVDGIEQVNPDDYATVMGDRNLRLYPRPSLDIFYLGINNTPYPFDQERVRQAIAMAVDRNLIVQNYFQTGSELATHFTPCIVPSGCAGEAWYEFNPARARELLTELWLQEGFGTNLVYINAPMEYLAQPKMVAQDIQRQLKDNLKINVALKEMEADEFQQAAATGQLPGLFLSNWHSFYPDVTAFLDVNFGIGAPSLFGDPFEDITGALKAGAALISDEARWPYYENANNAIRLHIPAVPIAHGGWALAYLKTVEGAHASPMSVETFAAMVVPGQDVLTWMQRAEPSSLYCAYGADQEALRACSQVTETLYHYQIGGAAVEPALAEICEPDGNLSVWTCRLRQGVLFHDGSTLDAGDVALSFVVQWDASNPLHGGDFHYWNLLWGAFLNAAK